MAEYDEQGNEIEAEEPKSIWELMNEEEPPDDDEYEEEQEEADAQIAKDDKLDKKLSAKFAAREKKFEKIMLEDRVGKYQANASELEVSLFKAVASDVKTLADFDKTITAVSNRAKKMEAAAAQYQAQLEAQAAAQTAAAWGSGPICTAAPRNKDADAEMIEDMKKGNVDMSALLASIVGDDVPWNR